MADPRPSGRPKLQTCHVYQNPEMSLRRVSESHSLSNGLGSLPVFETRDDDGTVIDDGRRR